MSVLVTWCVLTPCFSLLLMVLDMVILLFKNGPDLIPYLQDLSDKFDQQDHRTTFRKVVDFVAIVAKTLSGYTVVVVLMAWIRNETFLEGLIDRLEKELSK